jgi:hypothetical protein
MARRWALAREGVAVIRNVLRPITERAHRKAPCNALARHVQEGRAWLGAVTLRGFKVELADAYERDGVIRFRFTVADSSMGIPIELNFNFSVGAPLAESSEAGQADILRRALLQFFSHEVDELLQRSDGTPYRDPHGSLV